MRLLKQIIIAVIFLIIFTGIGVGVYYLLKPEQIETPPPLGPAKNIEVLSVDYVISERNKIDAVAKIKNPNNDYGTNLFDYKFDVMGGGDSIIATKTGTDYILSGQSKYIIELGMEVSDTNVSKIVFEINNVEWEESKDLKDPSLVIKDKVFQYSSKQGVEGSVSGILVNESNYDFDKINIKTILYDNKDGLIGIGKTELRTVLSSEKRHFEINWSEVFDTDVARIETEANTNILDSDNILKSKDDSDERFLRLNE